MAQACLNFELGGDGEEMQDEESECLHPSNVAETEQVEESEFPSLNPEEEEDEEPMPDHNFEVKTVVGKYGKAKGVPRESVKLYLGNYTFRKRTGAVFSCSGCEKLGRYLSAIAEVEGEEYHLVSWPRTEDHICWTSGYAEIIQKARDEMNSLVLTDPTRSLVDIYETVRSNCTEDMDSETKISFLQEFPSFRTVQANLYRKRREIIPADPKAMTDLKVDLKLFQYNDEEVVIKGDQVFSNGRRVVMYTTNDHLEILARAKQVLGDGTFRVTPKLWCQTFIISVSVSDDCLYQLSSHYCRIRREKAMMPCSAC